MTKNERIRVLATGTFDKFHPGHEYFLKHAKELGTELHVIIARDDTVKEIKNKSPKNDENSRLEIVRNFKHVDFAYLGELDDPYKLITNKIKPNIIALGYDQVAFTDNLATILSKKGLKDVKIVRIDAFLPQKYKSSKIL